MSNAGSPPFFDQLNAQRYATGGYVGSGSAASVASAGGFTIELINNGEPMKARQEETRTGPDGRQLVRIVLDTVKGGFAKGEFDQSMAQYGVRRQGVSFG